MSGGGGTGSKNFFSTDLYIDALMRFRKDSKTWNTYEVEGLPDNFAAYIFRETDLKAAPDSTEMAENEELLEGGNKMQSYNLNTKKPGVKLHIIKAQEINHLVYLKIAALKKHFYSHF